MGFGLTALEYEAGMPTTTPRYIGSYW